MSNPSHGGILLMMLVIFGMFMVMLGASILFINRQYHETVNQEQEERAFHLAEAGVQYTMFLLNDSVYTTQELLTQGAIEDQSVTHPSSQGSVGTFSLAFYEVAGENVAQAIEVVSVGRDEANRRCQTIRTIIRHDIASSSYYVGLWDHLPTCEYEPITQTTPTPTLTPTPTATPTPTVTPTPTPTVTPTPSSSSTPTPTPSPSPTSGLADYWKFDEGTGTTALNSASTNHGSLSNGAAWSTNTPSTIQFSNPRSIDFDGVDDYVSVGDINAWDGMSAFTVSAWVQYDTVAELKPIIAKFTTLTSPGWAIASRPIALGGPNDFIVAVTNGSFTDGYGYTTGNLLSAGTWYHVTMVYDGTQATSATRLKFYLNGTQRTLSFNGTIPTTAPSTANDIRVGAASAGGFSDAKIDDVRIYNRALSATEVAQVAAGNP